MVLPENTIINPPAYLQEQSIEFLQTYLNTFLNSIYEVNFNKYVIFNIKDTSKTLNNVVRIFMTKVELETKFLYHVKFYECESCYKNQNSYFVSFFVCIHQNERIHGKVIKVQGVFDIGQDSCIILLAKVLGNIMEDQLILF